MTLKMLDLFGGIGGFRLGLSQSDVDIEPVGYYDIDKFAVRSYNRIFNETHEPTDISELDTERIPDHDLLCAGFPCQSFSIAGKRQGFDDTRGTLFFEIARIAKAKRPAYLLLENVKGLLSHDDGTTFKVILETLDELGYYVEWQVLNSRHHGVPQNRERVFLVGHLGGEPRRKVFPIYGTATEDLGEDAGERNQVTHPAVTEAHGRAGSSSEYLRSLEKVAEAEVVKKMGDYGDGFYATSADAYTVPSNPMSDKQQLVINHQERPETRPSIAEEGQSGGSGILYNDKYSYALSGSPHFVTEDVDGVHLIASEYPDFKQQGGVYNPNGLSPTLSKYSMRYWVPQGRRIRKLTPRECWRLQGFPDWAYEFAEEVNSDAQLYKQARNAVTVNVISDIGDRLSEVV